MFDRILKPKFYSKCKTCLKLIKMRLETLRKKKNAVQKFLKKDIAELLRSSLDYNAYGRAEGLLVEQNMSACYELIAKFLGYISDHLPDLCKQKDCPDECKEAIPSLIYAAARFSDLPELRELRTLFTEKFGNSLEPYICKEFVEKLRQHPPTKEMKIQLLHDIAHEFSIEWDAKSLEQKLYSPLLSHEEKPKHHPQSDYGDVKNHMNNDDVNPKIDDLVTGDKQRDGRDALSQGRKENDISDGPKACSTNSLENVSENDEAENKRPFSYRLVPPPYVIENKDESNLKGTPKAPPQKESNQSHDLHEPVVQKKPVPRSVRRRRSLILPPAENSTLTTDSKTSANGNSKGDKEERMIDGLLMHYSKKQSTPYEHDNNGENRRHAKSSSCVTTLSRGTSLPLIIKDTTSMETLKGHGRSTSLVPEIFRTASHVHPSLPDYDDLQARLAALRGT